MSKAKNPPRTWTIYRGKVKEFLIANKSGFASGFAEAIAMLRIIAVKNIKVEIVVKEIK